MLLFRCEGENASLVRSWFVCITLFFLSCVHTILVSDTAVSVAYHIHERACEGGVEVVCTHPGNANSSSNIIFMRVHKPHPMPGGL